jgi:hypothetical protein
MLQALKTGDPHPLSTPTILSLDELGEVRHPGEAGVALDQHAGSPVCALVLEKVIGVVQERPGKGVVAVNRSQFSSASLAGFL